MNNFTITCNLALLLSATMASCHDQQMEAAVPLESPVQNISLLQVDKAISCSPMGLTQADSILYMQGGGQDFEPTVPATTTLPGSIPEGMVFISGGEFSMGGVNPAGMHDGGKETMYDARPVHRVYVDPFFMDESEVTNAQFKAFVKATGYITIAERKPTAEEFPGAPEENLVAGSVVFTPPAGKVRLDNFYQWWSYVKGANWKHPSGESSSIEGKDNYPVVQVCWEDAAAYAKWAGKRLPTEAEWEFAARGNTAGELYPWGNNFKPGDQWMANIFQGSFPDSDIGTDGYIGLAPVKQFAPNAFGLYCWEWCADWYDVKYYQQQGVQHNPRGPQQANDPQEPGVKKKVQRGGSFLCTDQYCTRYMVGTRGKGEWRSGADHLGFRCVKS
jgi:sulfatase modifying factor 1